MCMYENYMRRKAEQIRKLKRFQWHLDRTTTSSSSPSTSGLEGNSDTSNSTQCKEQKRSQSTEATDRTVTTDNIDQATSSKDCTSVCSDRRTRTSVSSSRKRKYEATVRSSENKSSSQKVYPESHAPQNSSKRNV
ncbi:osteocalcin 2-like [Watersipora subatra]|uniref:osteocalcin 2-like n=1 Tax=Watersipora subatra TaxID=2589382 RepID=UPI00355C215C